jgi:hypothetical protein
MPNSEHEVKQIRSAGTTKGLQLLDSCLTWLEEFIGRLQRLARVAADLIIWTTVVAVVESHVKLIGEILFGRH